MEYITFYALDANGNRTWAINENLKKKFAVIYNTQFDKDCPKTDIETGGQGWVKAEEQERLMIAEIQNGSFAQPLQKCSDEHLANAYLTLAINGVSIEKCFTTEAYLQARNVKVGKNQNGQDVWGALPAVTITGYGEIKMRRRAGQIEGVENPVIVYDCDQFAFGEQDGKKVVNYMKTFNRPENARIIACYLKILLKGGKYDYFVMDYENVNRLAGYSAKQNTKRDRSGNVIESKPNALYTSNNGQIDTGFLIAKTIKHAFKSYPRLEIGNAVMESDEDINTDSVPLGGEANEEVAVSQEERNANAKAKGGVAVETNENDTF